MREYFQGGLKVLPEVRSEAGSFIHDVQMRGSGGRQGERPESVWDNFTRRICRYAEASTVLLDVQNIGISQSFFTRRKRCGTFTAIEGRRKKCSRALVQKKHFAM